MTMRKLFIPLIFVLSGCGDNTAPADMSTTTKEHEVFSVETDNSVVNRELPFIRQQLPGLDKYAGSFEKIEVSKDSERPVTTVQFHIKDENNIPSDYIASGNNCYLFISNNAHEVKIPKSACQAVFFDKTDVPGGDLIVKLDKENLPMTDDDKPPRAGCLKVYSPDPDNDYWACPRLD
ncbi:TPA: hypothetical protein RHX63_003052 [Escherichia coli]|nr:hypothetical protein [Escherichia coli]HDQ6746480.1 hypothetical protein [Escherichia coli O22:H16]EEZ9716334.1 hypothetical protein [Escherichia coli]EGM5973997.1 hypothetical protein [Escherichia coli]EHC5779907.1 hypothetical protein [Escherichia coli]